jgi:hypothetical protein
VKTQYLISDKDTGKPVSELLIKGEDIGREHTAELLAIWNDDNDRHYLAPVIVIHAKVAVWLFVLALSQNEKPDFIADFLKEVGQCA